MERTLADHGDTAADRSPGRARRRAESGAEAEIRLRSVQRVLTELAGCEDEGQILECVARELARLAPTREVWWFDEEAATLRRLAGGGAPLEDLPWAALDAASRAALAQARQASAPIVLAVEPAEAEGGKLALLVAPLRQRGRTLALLGVLSGRGAALQGPVLDVLAALAAPLAATLHRVRLAGSLAQEKALWEAAFDAIAEPVLLVESGHRVLRANRAALAALRELAPGCEAERCRALCGTPEAGGAEPCALGEALARGAPQRRERRGVFGQRERATLVSSYPLAVAAGAAPRVLQIHRDVSQERELQHELLRTEQLSTLGKIAAGVAHEIRNPLAAITHSVSVLRQGLELEPEERELIEIVLEESRRVNRIVSDFLSFARPAAGEFAPGRLEALVDSTARLLRKDPRCSDGVELLVDCEPELPAVVLDRDRIRQVVWNLLLNAVQAAGPRGRVCVAVRRAASDGAEGVLVEVADSGAGIPAELGERVFDPFATTKPNGTGLGLSLARHIVELHSGWIRAERSAQGGALLRFWLPIARRQAQ